MFAPKTLPASSKVCVAAGARRPASFRVRNGRPTVRAQAWFNKLRPSSEDAGIYGSQGRDDFNADDVEQYFNYMGMLATEGTYDRLEETLKSGLHPVDILLLWAAKENDDPKVLEVLSAGADITVKDLDGKTALELATSPEVKEILEQAVAKE
ncbi:hypothetical protein BSKO_03764 [Bryopsis sp. KO-2023]|nr:hypothetical protein BSKO_03764 [Bryopsis sp. KO-2023]